MGKLKTLIHKFDDLWAEVQFDDLVDKLEAGRKPLLELEIHAGDPKQDPVKVFERMDRFRLAAARLGYWVEFKDDGSVPGLYSMFASRILSVVQAPMTLYRSNDQVAGLMGVLYGYPLASVFRYCLKLNPDELLEGRRRVEYVAELRDQIRFLAPTRPRRSPGRNRGRKAAGQQGHRGRAKGP